MLFRLTILLITVTGCASVTPQTDKFLHTKGSQEKLHLNHIPNYKQSKNDCGPTALSMVLESFGLHHSAQELNSRLLTPKKSGSLPAELMSAPRDYAMMVLPVSSLQEIESELASNRPVIVLLNKGFSWWPVWHYSVVVGFDRREQEILLHSGQGKIEKIPMTFFERHWRLTGHWGMVIGWPNDIFPSGTELEHSTSASNLEAQGKTQSASIAYRSILKKWPKSLPAHVGLANLAFAKKDYTRSVRILEKLIQIHPSSKVARHNLKVAKSFLTK